jgi:hypothetical protein
MPLSVLTSRPINLRKSFCLMIIGTAFARAAGPQTGPGADGRHLETALLFSVA